MFYELWKGAPDMNIKQVNISHSKKGTIRGVHYEPWDKYIHVVSGKILAVIVDKDGNCEKKELTNDQAMFVPNGYGNSFQALEDTIYLYLVTDVWTAGKEYKSKNFNRLGIDWPIKDWIVSDKDLYA